MSKKEKLGDVMAHIPPFKSGEPPQYYKVGVAYKDPSTGRLSIKLDTLPIVPSRWTGWLNIFEPRRSDGGFEQAGKPGIPATSELLDDDDIPF